MLRFRLLTIQEQSRYRTAIAYCDADKVQPFISQGRYVKLQNISILIAIVTDINRSVGNRQGQGRLGYFKREGLLPSAIQVKNNKGKPFSIEDQKTLFAVNVTNSYRHRTRKRAMWRG